MFKLINNSMLNIYLLKKSNVKNDFSNNEGLSVKEMKYQPAYSREWCNSIYTFNKNTVKSLPSTDIYVSKLIKSHFNLFSKNFENKARVYTSQLKNRISKTNRIFIGKPEFKHTNDKVVITLYVYNQELLSYMKKMKNIKGLNYLNIFKSKSEKKFLTNINKHKLHVIKNIYITFLKKVNYLNTKYLNNLNYPLFNIEKNSLLKLIKKMLINIRLYIHIKKIIHLNRSKFNSIHIMCLRNLLIKIYGKNVEFNIVNLKNYTLNSSILTQILAIKLKARKGRPIDKLGRILDRINLPYRLLIDIPYRISNTIKKQNLIIRNSMDNNYTEKIPNIELSQNNSRNISKSELNKLCIKKIKNDKLNIFLNYLYPKQYMVNLSKRKEIFIKPRNLENTVLDNIKNKAINGIRLESKGRLSKRIASRTIFLMKQKGTTRNVYSSYMGVSSVLLRGNLNYNVDLSKSNNSGSLGSFGLKGWISSM